jgi:bacteriocin-like protein
MESLQQFESFEELSEEQLMSINGGISTSIVSSSDLGSITVSSDQDGLEYRTDGATGSSTLDVGPNGVSTTRPEGLTPSLDVKILFPSCL